MNRSVTSMTEGPYLRKIILLALPLMLGSVFQQLYSVVDTAIAGRFVGVEALAALGSTDWFLWLILGIIIGMTEAVAIVISQRFGARDMDGLHKAVATGAVMTAVLAGAVLLLAELIIRPFLTLVNVPQNVIGLSELYLRIYFAGTPIVAVYNLCAANLRALGNGRSPLVAMIIAALMNILLDLLFVVVFGWGVAGCAGATVISQLFAAIYCFTALQKTGILAMDKSLRRVDSATMKEILKLGAPISLQNTIISLGGVAVQYIINGFGYLFLASYTATNKLYGILEMAAISYGSATSAFVGQNKGAGRLDRVKKGTHLTVLLAAATSLVITTAMLLFGKYFIRLFVDPAEAEQAKVIETAFLYLKIMAIPLSTLYILHTYRSALQGAGNTLVPMISGFAELCMRIGSAYLLSRVVGSTAVFLAEPLAWTGADIILITSFYITLSRLKKQAAESVAVKMEDSTLQG